jgi:hypothetical protein
MAYGEKSPFVGVDCDPDGWHTLEPVVIRGKILSTDVEVKCTVGLQYVSTDDPFCSLAKLCSFHWQNQFVKIRKSHVSIVDSRF